MSVIKLDATSESIIFLSQKDKRLKALISMIGPITYKTYDDPYQFVIHEIIEQMLSAKAAQKIYERLENLCDGKVSYNAIDRLSDEKLKSVGTSAPKVKYIRNFTCEVAQGTIDFSRLATLDDVDIIRTLTSVKGIGNWTAKMYLIFVLDRQDVLPYEDVAFLQSYKWLYNTKITDPQKVRSKCKKWSPYSSVAARYLYKALDGGYTKNKFVL